MGLQTAAKLLRMMRRKRTPRKPSLAADFPQISADWTNREKRRIHTRRRGDTKEQPNAAKTWATNQREETLMAFVPKFLVFADIRSSAHDPPGWARAA